MRAAPLGVRGTGFVAIVSGMAALALAVASCSDDARPPAAPEVDSGRVDAPGDTKDGGDGATDAGGDASDDFPVLKPVVLEDKQNHPLGIALDKDFVYWVNSKDGAVLRLSRSAKPLTKPETLSSGLATPERIAVDKTHAYVTSMVASESRVLKMPLAGAPVPEAFAIAEKHPRDILVDDTHVYWTNNQSLVVRRQAKTDTAGSAESVFAVSSSEGEPWGIAAFGDKLYVTTFAVGGNIYEHGKTPTFVPDAGSDDAKRAIAIAQDTALAIAVDAANVYWTVKNSGFVLQIPRTSPGSPTVLATKQNAPLGITVDDAFVYWCSNGGEKLLRVQKGGDALGPKPLADKQVGCSYVVTDGTFVYWTNEGGGTSSFEGQVMAMRLK